MYSILGFIMIVIMIVVFIMVFSRTYNFQVSGAVALFCVGIPFLFLMSFFKPDSKNDDYQKHIQIKKEDESFLNKIKRELNEIINDSIPEDSNKNSKQVEQRYKNTNSKKTEQNNSIEGQLFFTGKDRNFGEDEDKYYLIEHQFAGTLSSCKVIKVSGNISTKLVYVFYNFYTDESQADYTKYLAKNDSQNDSHLEEVDKGNISMTVSPVVHALWSQFVEPKVKSSAVSKNKNFTEIPSEYYIGKFNVSNAEGYLLTETLRKTGNTTYEARLKAIFPSGQVQFIDYFIDIGEKSFSNSDGFNGKIDEYRTPIEYGIFRYILGNM